MILGVAVVAIASYYIYHLNGYCKYEMEPSVITNTLNAKLYGQDRAIKEISQAMKSTEDFRIMIFTGGTGQGKTYASQLITHAPSVTKNIHRIMKSNFIDKSYNFGNAMKWCGYNIIIIDDLTLDDVNESAEYVKNIYSQLDKVKLDIIMIFNIEDVSLNLVRNIDIYQSHKLIREHFEGLPINIITFVDMDRDSIRNCVEDALKESLIYSQENVAKVMSLLSPDAKGCKEVYSKVSLT